MCRGRRVAGSQGLPAGTSIFFLLAQVCRLFDLFLATHPLMPLYVGAAAMHSQRQQLLAADEMPILHSKLVNLSITKMATADQLAIQVRQKLFAVLNALVDSWVSLAFCEVCPEEVL